MKYIALTFKNIKKFVIHHPVIFTLFVMVQIICCIAAFITCGMANNMYAENTKAEKSNHFSFHFESNADEYEKMTPIFEKDENGNLEHFYVENRDDISDVSKRIYEIKHEGVVPMSEMRVYINTFVDMLNEYRLKEINMGLYDSAITNLKKFPDYTFGTIFPEINDSNIDKIYLDTTDKIILAPSLQGGLGYKVGQTYNIHGYDYKCVAEREHGVFIPYNALDDEFVVYGMMVAFEDKLTQSEIDKVTDIFNSVFGTRVENIYPPEPYDPAEVQLNQMVYVISLVVMVIILLAIAKFYNYVLSDRKNTLTILRLCGCTRGKVHIIYMLEIFLTMIVTSAIGFVLFRFVFFKGIAELYPSFKDFYTDIVYIAVMAVYIVLAMIIMAFTIIPSTKASITDMKRQ